MVAHFDKRSDYAVRRIFPFSNFDVEEEDCLWWLELLVDECLEEYLILNGGLTIDGGLRSAYFS